MIRSLHISIVLLGCYFFILFFDSLLWLADLPVYAGLPLAIPITLTFYYFLFRPSKKVLLIQALVLTGLIMICAGIAALIFDNSHDGQTYHYETQAVILRGWNPLSGPLTTGQSILFINHYPKGFETAAANFWSTFGHPESGKALNLLMFIAGFFYVDHFLKAVVIMTKKLGRWIVALLVVLNPVTVCQLFNYYVDGQLTVLFTILVLSLYSAMKFKGWNIHLLFAGLCFCLMADLKFTGIVYACMLFGLFGIWILLRRSNLIPMLVTGVAALFITLFIGFNPYVINTVDKSNPFYPLIGKDKIDIMTPVQPLSFAKKNTVTKFIEANLARSHNIGNNPVTPEPQLKIPFTFSIKEWLTFKGHEARMAGYGPLFSGILLITVLLSVAVLVDRRTKPNKDALYVALIILLTVFINPEMWFSRYVPQLWLIPFCIFWSARGINTVITKAIIPVSLFVIALNSLGIAMVNWGAAGLISYKMHKELQWLKQHQPVQIHAGTFIAPIERLNHYRIKFVPLKASDRFPEVPISIGSQTHNSNAGLYRLQNTQAYIKLQPGQQPFINTGILKLLDQK